MVGGMRTMVEKHIMQDTAVDDRGSHELVPVQDTRSQSSASRQQPCAVGICYSTASARVSRGSQIHGPSGSHQALPLIYSNSVVIVCRIALKGVELRYSKCVRDGVEY